MSAFPYDTRSPAPTSGALGVVNSANESQSYFAPSGSGGGGGGGPNLQVSSIQVAGGGEINMGVNAQLILDYSAGSGAQISFDTDPTGGAGTFTLFQAYPPDGVPGPQAPTLPVPSLIDYQGLFGTLQLGSLIFDGNGQGSSDPVAFIKADPTGLLNVWGAGMNISSITVSSINGQTPGGGGSIPNNLVVSTVTASTIFATNALKVSALGQYSAESDFVFNSDKTVATTDFRFYASTQTFTPEGASANSISIFNPANDLTNTVTLTSQQGGPGQLRCDGGLSLRAPTVSISSINASTLQSYQTSAQYVVAPALVAISSINGQPYSSGGSSYPVISTIKPGGGGGAQTQYFTSTGAAAQVLTAFSTQVGHNYMLSIPYSVSTFNNPSYGDAIQFTSAGPGASDFQYTQPLIQGGSWNFPLSFKNKVGNGGVAVLLTANTGYPVEINLGDSDGAELVDLGPSQ